MVGQGCLEKVRQIVARDVWIGKDVGIDKDVEVESLDQNEILGRE